MFGGRTVQSHGKGQYKGKSERPSIVLEAVADYNTWIWHNRFGFAGTLNDINVWDQSSLLRKFLDGSFTDGLDFQFRIGNDTFGKLYVLVDGIYPELSRFVKAIQEVPISKDEKVFLTTKWQELFRKCVERAFGVLCHKFQILSRPMEQLYEEEIRNVVDTCIILHNMMVETRLHQNEDENQDDEDFDEPLDVPLLRLNIPIVDPPVPTITQRLQSISLQWPNDDTNAAKTEAIKEAMLDHCTGLQDKWKALYNHNEHF
jgi:Plant transposon protein